MTSTNSWLRNWWNVAAIAAPAAQCTLKFEWSLNGLSSRSRVFESHFFSVSWSRESPPIYIFHMLISSCTQLCLTRAEGACLFLVLSYPQEGEILQRIHFSKFELVKQYTSESIWCWDPAPKKIWTHFMFSLLIFFSTMKKPSVAKKPAVADQSPPPKMPGRSRSSGDVSGLADALKPWVNDLNFITYPNDRNIKLKDRAKMELYMEHLRRIQQVNRTWNFSLKAIEQALVSVNEDLFFRNCSSVLVKLKMFLDDKWLASKLQITPTNKLDHVGKNIC